jgi:uncharacterized alkaline shock family protein YloU
MAILVVVGLFLVFLAIGLLPVEGIKQILISIQEQIIPTLIVGALLLVGGSYLFYILAREIRLGSAISFQNPEGEVKVLLSAIEEFLKRLEGRIDGVREMKPKLLMTKKGLEINARVTLEPNTNIPEATTRAQETLREYVEGVLGIKNIALIKVLITKIADEHEREESEVTRP